MTIPVYNTGTVSVAANGTDVSNGGTAIWSNGNVKEGDWIVIDGEALTMVLAVVDTEHVTIPEWQGGAKTNVPYAIYQNYSARDDSTAIAKDVGTLVAALNKEGFIWFVGSDESSPDPSRGDDGQWAYQPSTGKQWHKEGGAWIFDGVFKGLGTPAPYDNSKTYSLNEVATSGGSSYVWINPTPGSGHSPPNATYWEVLAARGPVGPGATVEIGTVTTGAPGTSASVVNSGTDDAAVFEITIPRGDPGAGDVSSVNKLSEYSSVKDDARKNLGVYIDQPYGVLDFDSATTTGNFSVADTATNAPRSGASWFLEVARGVNGDYVSQVATILLAGGAGTQEKWMRTKQQGAWWPWMRLDNADKGYIFGLTVSNNATDIVNDIDVAIGEAADSAAGVRIALNSLITKRLDATWAAGHNQGGLDTGSIANGTYHVFLIQRSGTGAVDVLLSLSSTAPVMPSGYDRKRRIWSVKRIAGAIIPFKQSGDYCKWVTTREDFNTTSAVANRLLNLSVPAGIRVIPLLVFSLQMGASAGAGIILIDDGDNAAALTSVARAAAASAYSLASNAQTVTNTAGQIRLEVVASVALSDCRIFNQGYIDGRDK